MEIVETSYNFELEPILLQHRLNSNVPVASDVSKKPVWIFHCVSRQRSLQQDAYHRSHPMSYTQR